MTRVTREWVRLPTAWIARGGLARFNWHSGNGASSAAALMTLIATAHQADEGNGIAHVTYDYLQDVTSLSRAKVSAGLQVLEQFGIVGRRALGRSTVSLLDYDRQRGWGKLPAKGLYLGKAIEAFSYFSLRKPAELNALKLYLLFVERRNNASNLANVSYDKIQAYTDIDRPRIKAGLNVLMANGLVHVEHVPSSISAFGVSNAYRLAYLDSYSHMGTQGRRGL